MNALRRLFHKIQQDDINAHAASCSFFIIVCFFPTLILLLSFMKYTPISTELISAISTTVPASFQDFFQTSVTELYHRSSIALLSFSAITTLWTSGKSFHAISRSLNQIYGNNPRSYLIGRIFSSLCALIFVYFIILFFVLVTVWKALPIPFFSLLLHNRAFLLYLLSFLVILSMYTFIPKKRHFFISQLPGTFFCTTGWFIFTKGYAIYSAFSRNFNFLYGSLTTIILMMLLLYFYLYIFLLGAELNAFLETLDFNKGYQWKRLRRKRK